MKNTLATKTVVLKQPTIITNNAAVTISALDTQGYDQADIFVVLGATDIALTVMKLTESDDDSSYNDVTGCTFGGTGLPALPSATDDNNVYAFHIRKCSARKRYLKPAITVGNGATGAYLTVYAVLSMAKEQPNSATLRGLKAEVFA